MARPAAVASAVGSGRFDAASIGALEAHVVAQRGGKADYDLEANLTLLSLYALHPAKRSWPHCTDALLLAVAALPETDHVAVTMALPADVPEDVKAVQQLAAQLESGALGKVWATLGAQPKWSAGHERLTGNVRRFILGMLQSAYQSVRKTALAEALHVPVDELSKQPGAEQWTMPGEYVAFPLTEANQPRPRKTGESVPFEQLSKVLISTQ